MKIPDDRSLIERLSKGDQVAMKQLFHQHYQIVFRSIFRIIRQEETSKDLAQDVFVKLWKKRDTIEIKQNLEGYLATMAYHEALGYKRKKSNQFMNSIEIEPNMAQVDGRLEVESIQTRERIETAISMLPGRCQEVFTLSRFGGKSYKEIAEIMGISVKTVENQMSKALSTLRLSLQDLLVTALIISTLIH